MYGLNIDLSFERPAKELVKQFYGLPVANIDDNMQRIAAIDAAIRPMNKAYLLGTAFTVRVPAGDNLMFHKAMDLALPGDVIVIDAGGVCERAIFGELMTTYCKIRRLAGIVVDGAIRDAAAISKMDFPVYAKGVTPNGPYKNGPGEIGGTVSVGGKVVNPGDILVGDSDGLVIIRPEDAPELLEKTKATQKNEQLLMEIMLKDGTYNRPWVDEKLKALGCKFSGKQ